MAYEINWIGPCPTAAEEGAHGREAEVGDPVVERNRVVPDVEADACACRCIEEVRVAEADFSSAPQVVEGAGARTGASAGSKATTRLRV